MNDAPERYTLLHRRDFAPTMTQDPTGEWVRFGDYAALEQERDEARQTYTRLAADESGNVTVGTFDPIDHIDKLERTIRDLRPVIREMYDLYRSGQRSTRLYIAIEKVASALTEGEK